MYDHNEAAETILKIQIIFMFQGATSAYQVEASLPDAKPDIRIADYQIKNSDRPLADASKKSRRYDHDHHSARR